MTVDVVDLDTVRLQQEVLVLRQRISLLKRLLAQTEIQFSNSLIESFWRVLKHQWLYLNDLDTVANLRKLVAFYVEQHNSHLPHSAFQGQTPDEMYFGTGEDVPHRLKAAKLTARTSRMETNRQQRCRICEDAEELVSLT